MKMTLTSLILGLCAVPMLACSVSTTPNSVTVKTQPETDAPAVTKTSTRAWQGGNVIEIANDAGDIIVQGDPNGTSVSVTATPFARSDVKGDADASASLADVAASIVIDESQPNKYLVKCSHGASHGTSNLANSGCKNMTITVPAGTAAAGLILKAHTGAGSVTAPNPLVAAAGIPLVFISDAGNVNVASVNGGVQAHTDVGDATASVVPQVGSQIEVSSGNGDVTLGLPASFAADSITLKGMPINVTGFGSDFTAGSTSRGAAGSGASKITVTTDLGACTVKAQ